MPYVLRIVDRVAEPDRPLGRVVGVYRTRSAANEAGCRFLAERGDAHEYIVTWTLDRDRRAAHERPA